jgi:hypothetical protein
METSEILKVRFGEETRGRTQVFEQFSKFKSGVSSAEDAKRLGQPKQMKMWIQ